MRSTVPGAHHERCGKHGRVDGRPERDADPSGRPRIRPKIRPKYRPSIAGVRTCFEILGSVVVGSDPLQINGR
jgi:hypothetical protein